MLAINFTYVARRAAVIAGAVAVVSAVACSDDTTAPHSPTASIPTTGAQSSLNNPPPPALLIVQVRTPPPFLSLITELPRVKFTAGGNDTVIVKDNSPTDKNPVAGVIAVNLPKAASMYYGACLFEGTEKYGVDLTKPHCKTVWTSSSTIDMGELIMHEYPNFGAEMVDAATSKLVRGGTMMLVAPDGTWQIVSDGGVGDIDGATNGIINFRTKGPGKFTYCETAPPTGYAFTNPLCNTVDLSWDMGIGLAVLHSKNLSRGG